MTQEELVKSRTRDWEELDVFLSGGGKLHKLLPASISRTASLYRAVCADLMRARAAGHSPDLIGYLNDLAARGHNALYSAPPYRLGAVTDLIVRGFPRAIRRHTRYVAIAAALFLVPGLVGYVGARASKAFAVQLLPEEMIETMEKSYAEGFGDGRDGGTNAMMTGFYVYNNVGIAFRCFATGILFGLGSIFFLVYNGLVIGAVVGLVARAGHGSNLLDFCCGHSSFELTAIVISGAAGIRMGYVLVETGGLTRLGSLRAHARSIAELVLGAAALLLVAAAIEGFWSPSAVPGTVKRTVALVLAGLVTAYFLRAGRQTR